GRRHQGGRRRPHAVRAPGSRFGFASREWRALRALASPVGIQKALEAMPYHVATTAWSPGRVLCEGTAHCLEGAIFAAAALRILGFPPLLLDLEAEQDSDHVIAVYRLRGHWGAIAKSNFSDLRFREPVYRSARAGDELLRELYEPARRADLACLLAAGRPRTIRPDAPGLDDDGGRRLVDPG